MKWSARTLPKIVLVGLDRGESKIGRIMMWVVGVFFALMVVVFFLTPEPIEQKLPTVPWFLGAFGFFFGYFYWLSRKHLRAHRTFLARVLKDEPHRIEQVRVEVVVPRAGGVSRGWMELNGEREFVPMEVPKGMFAPRTWVHMKVRGKLVSQKLVVQGARSAELLSWLFAHLSEHHRECKWGEVTIAERLGSAKAPSEVPTVKATAKAS